MAASTLAPTDIIQTVRGGMLDDLAEIFLRPRL